MHGNSCNFYLPMLAAVKLFIDGLKPWNNLLETRTNGWLVVPTLFNQPENQSTSKYYSFQFNLFV